MCAALALLAVTACTESDDRPETAPRPSESPSPTTSWFPSPTPTPTEAFQLKVGSQAEARALLGDAFDFLLDQDSGQYETRATREPNSETFYSETGTYSLFDRQFEMTRHYREGGITGVPELSVTMRTIGGQRYMQMDQWQGPMAGCWMSFDAQKIRETVGIEMLRLPPYPLPVLMIGTTRVLGMSAGDDNVARVTVPTVTALQMLGLPAARVDALKVPWSMRSEATVTFVAGRFSELRIEGIETLLELEDIDLNAVEYSLIGDASATTSFYEVGAPVHVSAPPDDLVVTTEEEAEQGCNANLPDA